MSLRDAVGSPDEFGPMGRLLLDRLHGVRSLPPVEAAIKFSLALSEADEYHERKLQEAREEGTYRRKVMKKYGLPEDWA